MKRNIGGFVIAGLVFIAGSAVVAMEIPLPELAGSYDVENYSRTVTVDLGGPVPAINGASIHLVGTIEAGTAEYEGEIIPWFAEYIAAFFEPVDGFWYAAAGYGVDGEFDLVAPFVDFLDPDWDFFLDGTGELVFEFAPALFIPEVEPLTPPTGTITSATLFLDIPVGLEAKTWSQVKAAYR